MSNEVQLSQAEKDFLEQVCRFAERHAIDGVCLYPLYSKGLGAKVLLIFAVGNQAEQLNDLLLQIGRPVEANASPDKPIIEIAHSMPKGH